MRITDEQLREIASQHGTPLYLYDGDFLCEHYANVRRKLHPQIALFLSLKANNNLALLQQFAHFGSGIEVASNGELFLARQAGFLADRIVFSGPGKRPEELAEAIDEGIYCIIVESVDELVLTDGIAKWKGKRVAVGLRVNPDLDLARTSIKMAGAPRQFGWDESRIDEFFETLITLEHVHFRGIHVYTGTQQLEADRILAAFSHTIHLARDIQEQYGCTCEMINMGGGFGVPYFAHERPLDWEAVANDVKEMIDSALADFPKTRFIIESGRYLLAQTGLYLTQVLYVKVSKGEKFLITDGGMHHHAASTFRGRAMRNNFPMKLISHTPDQRRAVESVHVVGSLCTPEDSLAMQIDLPAAQEGDYLAILNSGAYGLSYSPTQFLGHETPKEVLLYRGESHVIRESGCKEDLLLRQRALDILLEAREW